MNMRSTSMSCQLSNSPTLHQRVATWLGISAMVKLLTKPIQSTNMKRQVFTPLLSPSTVPALSHHLWWFTTSLQYWAWPAKPNQWWWSTMCKWTLASSCLTLKIWFVSMFGSSQKAPRLPMAPNLLNLWATLTKMAPSTTLAHSASRTSVHRRLNCKLGSTWTAKTVAWRTLMWMCKWVLLTHAQPSTTLNSVATSRLTSWWIWASSLRAPRTSHSIWVWTLVTCLLNSCLQPKRPMQVLNKTMFTSSTAVSNTTMWTTKTTLSATVRLPWWLLMALTWMWWLPT